MILVLLSPDHDVMTFQGVYKWSPPIFSMFCGSRNSGISTIRMMWVANFCFGVTFGNLEEIKIDKQWLDHSLFFYVVPGEGKKHRNHRIIHFKQRGFPLKFGPFHVRDEVQTTSQIWEGVQGDGQGPCVKHPCTPSDSWRCWSPSEISSQVFSWFMY